MVNLSRILAPVTRNAAAPRLLTSSTSSHLTYLTAVLHPARHYSRKETDKDVTNEASGETKVVKFPRKWLHREARIHSALSVLPARRPSC